MRHSPFTAIFDACVLYPAPLRDDRAYLSLRAHDVATFSDNELFGRLASHLCRRAPMR